MRYEVSCANGDLLVTKDNGTTICIGDMHEQAEDRDGNSVGMSWVEAEINGWLIWADTDEIPYVEEGF